MGFWNRIFRRKKKPEVQEDWESIVYDRDTVDFREKEQRDRYISGCLEQIAEASKEISLLTGEYSLVTSYLTEMEEIEALPEEERETLNDIARRLLNLEQECEKYRDKKNRMNDSRYYRMRKQEEEIQEGIRKLSECEKYGGLVKQDMQRLDRERHAYDFPYDNKICRHFFNRQEPKTGYHNYNACNCHYNFYDSACFHLPPPLLPFCPPPSF